MSIQDVIQFVEDTAVRFGARRPGEANASYVLRNNTGPAALIDGGAYIGLVSPDEDPTGIYHDFSFTLMLGEIEKPWIVDICVGTSGFKNDYELATFPGLRRLFSRLIDDEGYCKSDFSDIETSLPSSFSGRSEIEHLSSTLKTYSKYLSACRIIKDPESDEGKRLITAFLAGYAKIRNWPTNQSHRDAIEQAISSFHRPSSIDPSNDIESLLLERKFVVLQGAPGTGKTRAAKAVAEALKGKTIFTQFHAETSFSDFVYGIRPRLNNDALGYEERLGSLALAIDFARQNPQTNTVLVIDEINRANLSNVLGPIFYLFEHKMDLFNTEIEVAPGISIDRLPDNFYVLATMNTADRSLAVVDFALRRRFAWYTLNPIPIVSPDFFKDDFNRMSDIFDWYANTEELSLQPGQGYFIASSKQEMTNRIRYELYPLISEYLQEGLLRNAKEEFNDYFSTKINRSLAE